MRDHGAVGGPQSDYDVQPVTSTGGAEQLRRRDPPPLQREVGSPITVHGDAIAAGKRDTASDFRIIVAARIRPFTEREVRQWRLERRAAAAAAAEELEETVAGAGRSGTARAAVRQPFGPDHRALNLATATSASPAHAGGLVDEHGHGVPDHGNRVASPDGASVPAPVVEVESDGRTIVLLEPLRTPGDVSGGGGGVVVRNAFTYDYVYSSLEPGVQLTAELMGGHDTAGPVPPLDGSPLRPPRRSVAGSYIIAEAESSAPAPPSGAPHALHTPEEEAQAEAEQVAIYEQLAIPLVDAALAGYNTCMFAYGQTGSGKTYTMMGTARHPGLIPRLCQLLFAQVAQRSGEEQGGAGTSASAPSASSAPAVTLQLSYLEIYNEQVRDLLKQRPKNAVLRYRSRFDKKDIDSDEYRTLKVRHHPSKGVYVDGLTTVPVRTWAECEELLQNGNALRTQCSTAMNAKSSRSHAIFQFQVTQREATVGRVRGRDVAPETFSKINLVDLAGSERNTQAKTTGKHLAEANSINASLSTLRRVLDGLVNNSGGKKAAVIPYRESLLTYILSDNLGGNSLTVMCANVSPCAADKSETESTLRYANLARAVVNHARLNEAPTARIIREMREQIKTMQEALRKAPSAAHVAELEEGVLLSEQLLREMRGREEAYETRLRASEAEKAQLRDAVAARETSEAYWRDEAQRRQEEVESLRAALRTAMSVAPTAAAAVDERVVRADAEDAADADDDGDDDAAAAAQRDGEAVAGESPTARLPSKDRKKKKAKKPIRRRSSLSAREVGGAGTAEAPQRRPSKPRGGAADRPLSIAALRDASRPGSVVLPSLRSGNGAEPAASAAAPAAATPVRARRGSNSGRTAAASTPSKSVSPTSSRQPQPQQRRLSQSPAQPKVRRISLSSLHLSASPLPPPPAPSSDLQAPSKPAGGPTGPRAKKKTSAARIVAGRGTPAEAAPAKVGNGHVRPPPPPLPHAASAASAGSSSARGPDMGEAPSFYQTVTYLTGAAMKLDGSSSVATSSARDGDAVDDRGSTGADVPAAHPPAPVAPRQPPQKRGRQRNTRVLEIEGGSPAPTSMRWPTNSPNVAAARQARAARDRRASTEAPVPSSAPVGTAVSVLPPHLAPTLPSQMPADANFSRRVSAEVNVRKTHRSTGVSSGSTSSSNTAHAHPPHPYSHLLETLPAGVARPPWLGEQPLQQAQTPAQRVPLPPVEAADSQGPPAAAASTAAAPSPTHSLASSRGRKASRQHGRAPPQSTSDSSSLGERHYSTVDMLGSVGY